MTSAPYVSHRPSTQSGGTPSGAVAAIVAVLLGILVVVIGFLALLMQGPTADEAITLGRAAAGR